MKKNKIITGLVLASVILTQLSFSGCGKTSENVEGTPTTMPTNTPTSIPSSTPLPSIEYTTSNLGEHYMPEWLRDAKFGIFIHYGVYSVPAYGDEWYGHWMYMKGTKAWGGSDIYSYHLNTYGGSAKFGYKDFIPAFNKALKTYKQNNMAEQWAKLFYEAGAKYVMPVGIHHDSFALYDSDVQTTYSSVAQVGVDYIGDLQTAVKSYGMKFGISNHFAENDWFFDDASAAGTDIAEKNPDGSLVYGELYGDGKNKSEAHIKKWYQISMEIINKYHPDMIYYDFDLGQNVFAQYDDANRYLMLKNYYQQAQIYNPEGVICCNKYGAFTEAEALLEKERSSLDYINPTAWQTDTSIGQKSWGYTTDEIYRTGEELIGALVDIVSKNGNLLLNVGPMPDGTIPEEAEKALLTIGKWLGTYGDAIYYTRPWLVSGEGPSNNTGDSFSYRSTDIRFTRSKDNSVLYVTALAKPVSDLMRVKTLASGKWDASTIKSISLIQGNERIALNYQQTADGLEIDIKDHKMDGAYSVEILFTDNIIPPVAVAASEKLQPYSFYNYTDMEIGHCTADGSDTLKTINGKGELRGFLDFSDIVYGSVNLSVSGASQGTIVARDSESGIEIFRVEVSRQEDALFRNLSTAVTLAENAGKLGITIELTGDIEIDSLWFAMKRTANMQIDASVFDDKEGAVQSEPTKDYGGGNSLGYVEAGNYVKYCGVDFGEGCNSVTLRCGADNRRIKIYADSISKNNLIASGTIATGGYDNYVTMGMDMKEISGIHDIYIVFTDAAINLNWFEFSYK